MRLHPLWSLLAVIGCGGSATGPTDPAGPSPSLACTIFPADNPWNTDVSGYPVHPESAAFLARLGLTWRLAFVANLPVNVVNTVRDQVAFVTIIYDKHGGDPGPMPIPADARYHVKDPSKLVLDDNHLVLVDEGGCKLYELWSVAGPNPDGSWTVGSGAIFDLTSNALRPDRSPASAASGLPVFAGIARAEEMRSGAIRHALSIPATLTQEGFLHPATQWQSDQTYRTKLPLACGQPSFGFAELCRKVLAGTFEYEDSHNIPMGLRLRLKASFDLGGYTGQARVLLEAARHYGLLVSDGSGTSGLLRGEKVADPSVWDWDPAISAALAGVPVTAFEVVQTGTILH